MLSRRQSLKGLLRYLCSSLFSNRIVRQSNSLLRATLKLLLLAGANSPNSIANLVLVLLCQLSTFVDFYSSFAPRKWFIVCCFDDDDEAAQLAKNRLLVLLSKTTTMREIVMLPTQRTQSVSGGQQSPLVAGIDFCVCWQDIAQVNFSMLRLAASKPNKLIAEDTTLAMLPLACQSALFVHFSALSSQLSLQPSINPSIHLSASISSLAGRKLGVAFALVAVCPANAHTQDTKIPDECATIDRMLPHVVVVFSPSPDKTQTHLK